MQGDHEPIDGRAPFTRRRFMAATGGAAVAAAVVLPTGKAFAAPGGPTSGPVSTGSILRIHPAIGVPTRTSSPSATLDTWHSSERPAPSSPARR